MDLAAVAHLAAIEGSVSFLHFFDGFRTSHEIQQDRRSGIMTIWMKCWIRKGQAFRTGRLNPNHPHSKGSAQNPDIFFQTREAATAYYNELPGVVAEYMDKVNEKIGTNYQPFNYYGAPDAEYRGHLHGLCPATP